MVEEWKEYPLTLVCQLGDVLHTILCFWVANKFSASKLNKYNAYSRLKWGRLCILLYLSIALLQVYVSLERMFDDRRRRKDVEYQKTFNRSFYPEKAFLPILQILHRHWITVIFFIFCLPCVLIDDASQTRHARKDYLQEEVDEATK